MYAELHAEWGQKRVCQACGAKFYDLGRSPATCPKCQAEFVASPAPKRSAPAGAKKTPWHARSKPNAGGGHSPWPNNPGNGPALADNPIASSDAEKEAEDEDEDADGARAEDVVEEESE